MRLLTLICFFHFSGLNNGMAYFAVSQGPTGPVVAHFSFASVLAQRVATTINPVNWKSMVANQNWLAFAVRSQHMIKYSSENAVQQIFDNGEIFQICISKTIRSMISKVGIEHAQEKSISQSYATDGQEPLKDSDLQRGSLSLLLGEMNLEAIQSPFTYINEKEFWLKRRGLQWNGKDRDELEKAFKILLRQGLNNGLILDEIHEKIILDQTIRRVASCRTYLRTIYAESGKEDDPIYAKVSAAI